MKPLAPRVLAAIAACVVALSCGGVPTFVDGIAFISTLQRPSLAIAALDTLRDSLGRVTPLRVYAFGQGDDTIRGVTASFLVTTLPAGVNIDANGIVTAFDSLRTVQIVARIGDRLQTQPANLDVVAQPDQMVSSGTVDSLALVTPSSPLQVTITGNRKGTRVPVNGIVVRYAVVATVPAGPIADSLFVFTEGVRGALTTAVDTTRDGGITSRTLIATDLASGIRTVVVRATAKNLKGAPFAPVEFVIPLKKGS
ncbi:MAG: hypothetical protein ABIT20_14790 [Gemmatimonadaceae bacterium]